MITPDILLITTRPELRTAIATELPDTPVVPRRPVDTTPQDWTSAGLVLIDHAAARAVVGKFPRRDDVVVLADTDDAAPQLWSDALALDATHVMRTPAAWPALRQLAAVVRARGPVVVVLGLGPFSEPTAVLVAAALAVQACAEGLSAAVVDTVERSGPSARSTVADLIDGARTGRPHGPGGELLRFLPDGAITTEALHQALRVCAQRDLTVIHATPRELVGNLVVQAADLLLLVGSVDDLPMLRTHAGRELLAAAHAGARTVRLDVLTRDAGPLREAIPPQIDVAGTYPVDERATERDLLDDPAFRAHYWEITALARQTAAGPLARIVEHHLGPEPPLEDGPTDEPDH